MTDKPRVEPQDVERHHHDGPATGPLGDVMPEKGLDPRTPGGLPQQKVEDRDNVGTVKPEDYPADQRKPLR